MKRKIRTPAKTRAKPRKTPGAEDGLLHFFKVSGAGNHFVLLDVRAKKTGLRRGPLVRALCAHGHSVGADGVLFLETSEVADFKLVYFNSDGREAPMCGNGTRCAAKFAFERGIVGTEMRIQTGSGLIKASVDAGGVELDMGKPAGLKKDFGLKTSFGQVKGYYVNTGVPHFVTVAKNLAGLDVEAMGREIRHHRTFGPAGANANFVRVLSKDSVQLRTYERGVEGETLACGTGAVAAAVSLAVGGLVKPPVKVFTQGGDVLSVRFSVKGNPLSNALLRGPAQLVYEGDIPVSVLRTLAAKVERE